MSCPGDLLSGLVDGELDHPTRERVLSHLLACLACSAEVQSLRALKTRLSWAGAETPLPSAALTDRLRRMAVPGIEPVARPGPISASATLIQEPAGALSPDSSTVSFVALGPLSSASKSVNQIDPCGRLSGRLWTVWRIQIP